MTEDTMESGQHGPIDGAMGRASYDEELSQRIQLTKTYLHNLGTLVKELRALSCDRASALAFDRAEEASLWLAEHLRGLEDEVATRQFNKDLLQHGAL